MATTVINHFTFRSICIFIFFGFHLVAISGGASSTVVISTEIYLKLTPRNNKPSSCIEISDMFAKSQTAQITECRVMRGALQTFRILATSRSNVTIQMLLESKKEEGLIAWYEFRGDDLKPQTIALAVLSKTFLDYYRSLQPKELEAQDVDFVDTSILRIRNLLTIYPPEKMVTVAVIDSGINFDNRILEGLYWKNTNELAGNGLDDDVNGYKDDDFGWDFVNERPIPAREKNDVLGHGTFIATIVAATAGLDASKWLRIMPLRVAGGSTGVGTVTPFALAEAIQYAVNNGAQVINISLGSTQSYDVVRESIDSALARGVKVVVSAGNTSSSLVLFPASLPGVFAVGALNTQGQIWSGSAQGDGVDIYLRGTNMLIDLPVSFPGLASSGTSYAAPIATALSAMMLALAGDKPHQCLLTRNLIQNFRPTTQFAGEWLEVLTNQLESEIIQNDLKNAWMQKQTVCGAQLTIASILRRSN